MKWFVKIGGMILTGLFSLSSLAGCGNNSGNSIKPNWSDLPYASVSAAQKLDIYLPNEAKGPFPVIISIHGGGFALGDKASEEIKPALEGLKRGYAVVAVNYRLSGEAIFPAQINDVKAAIRFVKANATKYNLNSAKIALWGGSAGGNLAALAGTASEIKELQDLQLGNPTQTETVQAVVDWFGPINFLTMDAQFQQSGLAGQNHNAADSFESKLLGKQITLVPDLVAKANPETYITADDPPFFIQHGTQDKLVPVQQSTEFAAKLEKRLGKEKVTIELLEGAGHGDQMFVTAANVNKVLDFLDKFLK